MRILRSRGLPSAGGERLPGDGYVRAKSFARVDAAPASLARGPLANEFEVRRVQEDVLDVRVSSRHEVRVVRHHGTLDMSSEARRRVHLRQLERHHHTAVRGLVAARRHEQRDLARHTEQSIQTYN